MSVQLAPYPEYKDSGVPWLGEVPVHWEVRRLKQCVNRFYAGGTPDSGTQSYYCEPHKGIPWLMISDMTCQKRVRITAKAITEQGRASRNLEIIPKGTLLYSIYASLGAVSILEIDAAVNQAIIGIRTISSVLNAEYGLFFLESLKPYVVFFSSSNTQANLSAEKVRSFLVLLPPLPEQSAIVGFLDHMDRRINRFIRAKRRLIALLNEQKQAIIHRVVTGQIDVRTGQPYPAYKPSGVEWLGDVPEHWEVRRAKHLFREVDHRSTAGMEVLLSLRMYQGLVPHNEVSTIPITSQALVGFKKIAPGQIVMNRMRAAIGMFGIADQPGLVSPDYAVLEPMANVDPMYFLQMFKTQAAGTVFRLESKGLGTGASGFMRLYTDRFGMIKLPVPPKEDQRRIVLGIAAETQEIDRTEERINREIDLIREYRTRLIADVVTGKLDVREAAALLPEEAGEPESLDEVEVLAEDGEAEEDMDLEVVPR